MYPIISQIHCQACSLELVACSFFLFLIFLAKQSLARSTYCMITWPQIQREFLLISGHWIRAQVSYNPYALNVRTHMSKPLCIV